MKIKVSSCFLDDPVTKKIISTKALVYTIRNARLYGCVHSTTSSTPEWFYRPDGDYTHVYDLEQIPDLSVLTDEEEFQLLTVCDYGTLKYEDVKKIQEHLYSTDILTCSIKDFKGSMYEIQI